MGREHSSALTFHLEETIWLDKEQQMKDLLSLGLTPDIHIEEKGDYVVIKGGLRLHGEYTIDDDKVETVEREFTPNPVDEINVSEEKGIISHFFPVDITIPLHRINKLDDIYVHINGFDYDLPEPDCIQLTAEVSITGMKNGAAVQTRETLPPETFPVWEMEKTAEPEPKEEKESAEREAEEEPPTEQLETEPIEEIATEEKEEESEEEDTPTTPAVFFNEQEKRKDVASEEKEIDETVENVAEVEEDTEEEEREETEVEREIPSEEARTEITTEAEKTEEKETSPTNEEEHEQRSVESTEEEPPKEEETESVAVGEEEKETEAEEEREKEKEAEPESEENTVVTSFRRRPEREEEPTSVQSNEENEFSEREEDRDEEETSDEETEDGRDEEEEKAPASERDDNALYLTKMMTKSEEQFSRLKMCIIQENESLETIAERYNTTTTHLIRFNRLENEHVEEGQILYIPASWAGRSANEK